MYESGEKAINNSEELSNEMQSPWNKLKQSQFKQALYNSLEKKCSENLIIKLWFHTQNSDKCVKIGQDKDLDTIRFSITEVLCHWFDEGLKCVPSRITEKLNIIQNIISKITVESYMSYSPLRFLTIELAILTLRSDYTRLSGVIKNIIQKYANAVEILIMYIKHRASQLFKHAEQLNIIKRYEGIPLQYVLLLTSCMLEYGKNQLSPQTMMLFNNLYLNIEFIFQSKDLLQPNLDMNQIMSEFRCKFARELKEYNSSEMERIDHLPTINTQNIDSQTNVIFQKKPEQLLIDQNNNNAKNNVIDKRLKQQYELQNTPVATVVNQKNFGLIELKNIESNMDEQYQYIMSNSQNPMQYNSPYNVYNTAIQQRQNNQQIIDHKQRQILHQQSHNQQIQQPNKQLQNIINHQQFQQPPINPNQYFPSQHYMQFQNEANVPNNLNMHINPGLQSNFHGSQIINQPRMNIQPGNVQNRPNFDRLMLPGSGYQDNQHHLQQMNKMRESGFPNRAAVQQHLHIQQQQQQQHNSQIKMQLMQQRQQQIQIQNVPIQNASNQYQNINPTYQEYNYQQAVLQQQRSAKKQMQLQVPTTIMQIKTIVQPQIHTLEKEKTIPKEKEKVLSKQEILKNLKPPENTASYLIFTKTFSDETRIEAQQILEKIFVPPKVQEIYISKTIKLIIDLKDSKKESDNDIYLCHLKLLLQAFNRLETYADEHLKAVALYFGTIINTKLIDDQDAEFWLSMITLMINSSTFEETPIFPFALMVIEHIKKRLLDLPIFCNEIYTTVIYKQMPRVLTDLIDFVVNCVSSRVRDIKLRQQVVDDEKTNDIYIDPDPMPPPSDEFEKLTIKTLAEITIENLESKSTDLQNLINEDTVYWLSHFMVVYRIALSPTCHQLYIDFIDLVDSRTYKDFMFSRIRHSTIICIRKILKLSPSIMGNYSVKLNNLGHWAGLIYMARNKPILYRHMDIVTLMYESFNHAYADTLLVFTFVFQVIYYCNLSPIFNLPCAWTVSVMNVLSEIYLVLKNQPNNQSKYHQVSDMLTGIERVYHALGWNIDEYIANDEIDKCYIFDNRAKMNNLHTYILISESEYIEYHNGLVKKEKDNINAAISILKEEASSILKEQFFMLMNPECDEKIKEKEIDKIKIDCNVNNVIVTEKTNLQSPATIRAISFRRRLDALAGGEYNSFTEDCHKKRLFLYDDISIVGINSFKKYFVVHPALDIILNIGENMRANICKVVESSLRDILYPIYETTIGMCIPTIENIIRKDFALDSGEAAIRAACHMSIKNLMASIINVIHRDAVWRRVMGSIILTLTNSEEFITIANNNFQIISHLVVFDEQLSEKSKISYKSDGSINETLLSSDKDKDQSNQKVVPTTLSTSDLSNQTTSKKKLTPEIEQVINNIAILITEDNLNLSLCVVEKLCIEQGINELNHILTTKDFKIRKMCKDDNKKFVDPIALAYHTDVMPRKLKLTIGPVSISKLSIYHDLGKCVPGFEKLEPDIEAENRVRGNRDCITSSPQIWSDSLLNDFFFFIDETLQVINEIFTISNVNISIHWIRPLYDFLYCILRNQTPSSCTYFIVKLTKFALDKTCDAFIVDGVDKIRENCSHIVMFFIDHHIMDHSYVASCFTSLFLDKLKNDEIEDPAVVRFLVRKRFIDIRDLDSNLFILLEKKKDNILHKIVAYLLRNLFQTRYCNVAEEFSRTIEILGQIMFNRQHCTIEMFIDRSAQISDNAVQVNSQLRNESYLNPINFRSNIEPTNVRQIRPQNQPKIMNNIPIEYIDERNLHLQRQHNIAQQQSVRNMKPQSKTVNIRQMIPQDIPMQIPIDPGPSYNMPLTRTSVETKARSMESVFQTIFQQWRKTFLEHKSPNKAKDAFNAIKPLLLEMGFFEWDEGTFNTFFKAMYRNALSDYYSSCRNKLPSDIQQRNLQIVYTSVDAIVRLVIVILINFHENLKSDNNSELSGNSTNLRSSQDQIAVVDDLGNLQNGMNIIPEHKNNVEQENLTQKNDYIKNAMFQFLARVLLALSTTINSTFAKATFKGMSLPYHRLINIFIVELYSQDTIDRYLVPHVSILLCNFLHSIRPTCCVEFIYSWFELVINKILMENCIGKSSTQNTKISYNQLIIDWLIFFMPLLDGVEMQNTIAVLLKSTGRLFQTFFCHYPDFLVENHLLFCDSLPLHCIHLRNIVLSATPLGARIPDPRSAELRVDQVCQLNSIAPCSVSISTLVLGDTFKSDLDLYLKDRKPITFLMDVINYLQVDTESLKKYSVPLMTGLVIYIAHRAIQTLKKRNLSPSVTTITHSPFYDIFHHLLVELDSEGRFLYLTCITNQLRFPNTHTHYFCCLMLSFYGETNIEIVKEQITRVLLERMIAGRPVPYGCQITFHQIISDPNLHIYKQKFINFNPQISKIIKKIEDHGPIDFEDIRST